MKHSTERPREIPTLLPDLFAMARHRYLHFFLQDELLRLGFNINTAAILWLAAIRETPIYVYH